MPGHHNQYRNTTTGVQHEDIRDSRVHRELRRDGDRFALFVERRLYAERMEHGRNSDEEDVFAERPSRANSAIRTLTRVSTSIRTSPAA